MVKLCIYYEYVKVAPEVGESESAAATGGGSCVGSGLVTLAL